MNICVVGMGYVGLPLSVYAAKAGFTVYGYDINDKKISNLKMGKTTSPEVTNQEILELQFDNRLNFVSKMSKNMKISIFLIAVPTPLTAKLDPDLQFLQRACEQIATLIEPDTLVINESTSFIGTLRNFIKPLIDGNSKIPGIKYAVAPERIDPGNVSWNLQNTPRVVSGLDQESINRARNFYESFCSQIYTVSKPEIAEAAKLLENTFRQVNIALINEFSEIASKYKFSMNAAVEAAATKPFGFMPFYPGIGVGGHCIPVDPRYLTYSADKVGIESKLVNYANSYNLSRPYSILSQIEKYFDNSISGKNIQLAGISYKINLPDIRESPALKLIELLRQRGANVSWHDPVVEMYKAEVSAPLSEKIDLGLIITPHSSIDFSIWKSSGIDVLDLSANTINYGWTKFF